MLQFISLPVGGTAAQSKEAEHARAKLDTALNQGYQVVAFVSVKTPAGEYVHFTLHRRNGSSSIAAGCIHPIALQ